ncbi:hypothetical protein DSO57_1020736 [Entomophthora muscae]|uniref:Uncharacterized protein n=1 Tax=Entomophthora muscae TaxID=34485 RepID=A0ACC2UPB6_9FUNG|nr:hypothetical protein DSO57_1020736 [Entomophthora muscae]
MKPPVALRPMPAYSPDLPTNLPSKLLGIVYITLTGKTTGCPPKVESLTCTSHPCSDKHIKSTSKQIKAPHKARHTQNRQFPNNNPGQAPAIASIFHTLHQAQIDKIARLKAEDKFIPGLTRNQLLESCRNELVAKLPSGSPTCKLPRNFIRFSGYQLLGKRKRPGLGYHRISVNLVI